MSQKPYDYTTRQGVHLISWEDFHGICKALAVAVSDFQPELLLPIGRGGYYPGTPLAHLLQIELYPIRVSRRVNDRVQYQHPRWLIEPPAAIVGRRVLVVDEMCDTGETLRVVKEKAVGEGAGSVRSAVLYAHSWSVEAPDYIGLLSDALVLNPWDREVLRDGEFHFHAEYVAALAQQGLTAGPQMLISASAIQLAKGCEQPET